MKINSLLESSTVASDTANTTNSAPKFGRDPEVLEEKDETVEESTTSGSVASVDAPIGGMQRRGKGSMFAGIKTSAKYPNSEAVKEGLPKEPKDEFKRQALLVKDRKTGKLYDPNVEFDKKMNSPEVKAQMKRMATKESQINEVDPRNFDSDEDYYRARNAPARQRSAPSSYPYSQQDDDAYFREIFRKKRLAAQQAERSADHDRLATGTNEGEEMGTFAALKDWRVWDVRVFNNFYRGKYADYGPRLYSVVASSPEEARQVVLDNPDYVLQDLLSRKLQNGKKVLPRGSALPIEEKRVGKAVPGSITTMAFKKMLTPDGVQSFKFAGGKIVDGAYVQGGEEVEEGMFGFGSSSKPVQQQRKPLDYNAVRQMSQQSGPNRKFYQHPEEYRKVHGEFDEEQEVAEGSDIGYHQTSGTKAGHTISSRKLSNKPQASNSDVTLQSGSMHHRGKSYNFPEGTLFTQLPGGIFAKHPSVPETVPGYGHLIKSSEDNIRAIHDAINGEQVNEKSKSQAQFRTMAAVAHNPEFAKKVGISQSVGKEFHSADKKQDYKDLPKEVSEGDVVAFPKKHKGDLEGFDDCPKCGGDLQGGKYMGHAVKVCMPCKQVYLPPNSGIDQQGNKIKEQGVAEEKQRLDPKCWSGYKKQGTKMKGDTRVNNCVPIEEGQGDFTKAIENFHGWYQDQSNDPNEEVYYFDDREGGYYADGVITRNLQTGEIKIDFEDKTGGEYGDDVKGTFNSIGSAINALRGITTQVRYNNGKAPKHDSLASKTLAGPDDLYKTDRAGKKGTLTKSRMDGMKASSANTMRGGPKGILPEAELNEEDMLAKELFKQLDLFKKGADKDIGSKAKDRDIGNKPRDKDIVAKGGFNGEYDDEAGSAESNLLTTARAVKGLLDTIEDRDNLPEWVQEKIAKAEGMLVTSWDYLLSQKEQGIDPQVSETLSLDEQFDMIEEMVEELAEVHGVDAEVIWEDLESVEDTELFETAAWRRKEGKNKNGGLNAKGVASYRRENPGSKLQTAVTTKPSKLKPGSKAAKRRKSFCARMSGMKGPMKKDGKPTRKALALRKWNC